MKVDPLQQLTPEEAIQVAEEMNLLLVPVQVFASRKEWNEGQHKPVETWWSATYCTFDPSIYLPLEQYEKEWGGWISEMEEPTRTGSLAKTFTEAVHKRALEIQRAKERKEKVDA